MSVPVAALSPRGVGEACAGEASWGRVLSELKERRGFLICRTKGVKVVEMIRRAPLGSRRAAFAAFVFSMGAVDGPPGRACMNHRLSIFYSRFLNQRERQKRGRDVADDLLLMCFSLWVSGEHPHGLSAAKIEYKGHPPRDITGIISLPPLPFSSCAIAG